MSRRISKRLAYEQLEQRKLLAADLAADIMQCGLESEPVEQCEVAMDLADHSLGSTLASDAVEEIANADQIAPRVQELDLNDGSDGFYGTMEADQTQSAFSFRAPGDGTVDIVVASTFGDASTFMEVRDSAGDLVSATATEGLDSFHTLRIEVADGEAYELVVSTEQGVEGNYQVTVGFAADELVSSEPGGAVVEDSTTDSASDSSPIVEESVTDPTDLTDDVICENPDAENDESLDSTDSDPAIEDPGEAVNDDQFVDDQDDELIIDETCDAEDLADDSDPQPSPIPEPSDTQPDPLANPFVDLHANDVGDKSTELSMATGRTTMMGQLESSGDVDTFRFTPDFDGSMDLFLADITSESDLDLNVSIFDCNGNELLDGATNEVVKLTFDVQADTEYFVSVSADEGQTGEYALIAKFNLESQPVDDHANQMGDEATELVLSEGIWTATGMLETANDQDAFRFTANCNETLTLAMDIDSEDHQSSAQISVFDDAGELIVQGTTNGGVDLAFEAIEEVEYQILVDSVNDISMSFDLAVKPIETATDDTDDSERIDNLIVDSVVDNFEEIAGCDSEADLVDSFFAEIGEERSRFDISLDSMSNELEAETSRLLRLARRI